MARSKSSGRWLKEHFKDQYVRLAQARGYRSRSAFKLIEMLERDRLLRPGMAVVDLGAAPGGWSQVAAAVLAGQGRIVALDILPMEALPEVEFIAGDFTEDEPLTALEELLAGTQVDLVMSDMAPNMSGMRVADQARAMYLAELALNFALKHLKPGGDFLVKVFHGEGFDEFLKFCRESFTNVSTRKPGASRPRSRELYILARGRRIE